MVTMMLMSAMTATLKFDGDIFAGNKSQPQGLHMME
jgi:hypothetical protein